MSFIETIPEASAEGAVAQMYERIRGSGELPNWARVFSRKPEVFAGWQGLIDAVKSGQDSRHFELATIGAARALSSSYCLLAHGKRLMQDGVGPDVLREIGETGTAAGLSGAERAIVDFAAKVAREASAITAADIDLLRAEGLSDREIFDVAATAAARCFFSKFLDALGVRADASFRTTLPADLWTALERGRAIAD